MKEAASNARSEDNSGDFSCAAHAEDSDDNINSLMINLNFKFNVEQRRYRLQRNGKVEPISPSI